ncbi:c-type cytochrome biogenesis protein CcmI [Rhodomicrobium sp. Az07]|uniref:c-type cytochrome biogenesis protein CcmI n=1 Tax=Rhodomicrobium sp. Az07 TaxID=2839034 RepID=UPI001BECBC9E|nr:c-type cytochrome biogenesis protein CcmI [Rhodomicrobium sp. Az07]MBT3071062.1 c-type cytochrome biogenesis protein CcmI [Rhodomicrobium sp. Az07]
MIWIIFALLTAGVILAVTRSLRRAPANAHAAASEVEVYKAQLAELDREAERGTVGEEETRQTRLELSRRLLRASRQGNAPLRGAGAGRNSAIAASATAALLALGTIATYVAYGQPGLRDMPLETRLDVPPEMQTADVLIAKAERDLRRNPTDVAGWMRIAPVYFRNGRFDKAADAYSRAIEYGGMDEEKLLGLGEALTFANDGSITDRARLAFEAAAKVNPSSLRVRLWSGLIAEQNGRRTEAEKIYKAMLAGELHPGLRQLVNQRLAALSAPPQANDIAQASPEDQGKMIRGMVDGLAARLKENKSDLEGWIRLIRSYAVLKENDKAKDAASTARQAFATDAKALQQIEAAVKEAGLGANGQGG